MITRIAHAGNQIDEETVAVRLVQPHRIFHLAAEALSGETAQGSRHVVGGKEEIQVFGGAPDSRMSLQRERTRDNIRDATAIQYHQRFPKHRFLLAEETSAAAKNSPEV